MGCCGGQTAPSVNGLLLDKLKAAGIDLPDSPQLWGSQDSRYLWKVVDQSGREPDVPVVSVHAVHALLRAPTLRTETVDGVIVVHPA